MENEFVEFQSEPKRHLSEIQLGENATFIDLSAYLELIINGPFTIWEEDGKFILLHVKARVDKYRGLEIRINPKEHPPPHFHVYARGVNASFTIEDCVLTAGNISTSDLRKVQYWHSISKRKLIEVWNSTRPTKCLVGKFRDISE